MLISNKKGIFLIIDTAKDVTKTTVIPAKNTLPNNRWALLPLVATMGIIPLKRAIVPPLIWVIIKKGSHFSIRKYAYLYSNATLAQIPTPTGIFSQTA